MGLGTVVLLVFKSKIADFIAAKSDLNEKRNLAMLK